MRRGGHPRLRLCSRCDFPRLSLRQGRLLFLVGFLSLGDKPGLSLIKDLIRSTFAGTLARSSRLALACSTMLGSLASSSFAAAVISLASTWDIFIPAALIPSLMRFLASRRASVITAALSPVLAFLPRNRIYPWAIASTFFSAWAIAKD